MSRAQLITNKVIAWERWRAARQLAAAAAQLEAAAWDDYYAAWRALEAETGSTH
jgi:hypothetical protein